MAKQYRPPADDRGWADRVRFARDGSGRGYAFRPGHVLVDEEAFDALDEVARRVAGAGEKRSDNGVVRRIGRLVEVSAERSPVEVARRLNAAGAPAQVNHVLFASNNLFGNTALAGNSALASNYFALIGNPALAGNSALASNYFALIGNPALAGNSALASNYFALIGNPALAAMLGYADCECPGPAPAGGNQPPPTRTQAQPASVPAPAVLPSANGQCRVVVIDTGLSGDYRPASIGGPANAPSKLKALYTDDPDEYDVPDTDGNGEVDPAAGHGLFVAAIIERFASNASVEVDKVLSTFGDTDDAAVALAIHQLLDAGGDPVNVLNMSLGGYTADDEPPMALADAVARLVEGGTVVVASAGNDAGCRPAYPAALDGVIAVGALAGSGPAPFTNYGHWVDACAQGVGTVSRFFEVPANQQATLGAWNGWASWSGTSFAAPVVAGCIAREILAGCSPEEAVQLVLDSPGQIRLPYLGTVVNRV